LQWRDRGEENFAGKCCNRAAVYPWSMIFSDLPSPAEASSRMTGGAKGFAQAGNRYPFFGIMLYPPTCATTISSSTAA
jgi:hypothetical protein